MIRFGAKVKKGDPSPGDIFQESIRPPMSGKIPVPAGTILREAMRSQKNSASVPGDSSPLAS